MSMTVLLFWFSKSKSAASGGLRQQQCLNRTALVHGAVTLRHLFERQRQVEDFARVDFSAPDQVDQLGKETAHRRWAPMKVEVCIEQLLPVELDAVRDAHIPH